jgi:adenine-specific DNA-methyltransferase
MVEEKKARKRPIEQYDHKGKQRVNNPPVGLVTPERDKDLGKKTYAYDPHIDPALQFDSQGAEIEALIDKGLAAQDLGEVKGVLEELKRRREPYLNWAGKAERTSFEVDTVSLHVHERIDPRTIIEAVRRENGVTYKQQQPSLFECREENPPLREAVQFYQHKHNWSNRLIAGDSLQVMNSLLEKEGLAGQVQMIYIDPPYGINYGSNFQPFINKRDVKDKDEDLTQEPEMIKAFKDTWELGIHSYLSYLRDRLLFARELLKETGSIFVQISDENVHLVRNLMDEVYGLNNFVCIISYRTRTMPLQTKIIDVSYDHIIWFARNKEQLKPNKIFKLQNVEGDPNFKFVEHLDGTRRLLTREERIMHKLLPKGSRVYRLHYLKPTQYRKNQDFNFEFQGKLFPPPGGNLDKTPDGVHSWATTEEGMKTLALNKRLQVSGNTIEYILYHDDYPVTSIHSVWTDTAATPDKKYVVQTSEKVVERCLLLTTNPGDLIFDPTCGSGTTAYCAEKWGRRWITCDTSRVAVTLAKQWIMTAIYDYYELLYPDEGVGSGFNYKKVPHITLESIANNEPIKTETLYDKPFIDRAKVRVSGPFTVEAVPAPVVKPLVEIEAEPAADDSLARSGETLRQAQWRDELLKTGIRTKGGQRLEFARLEALPGTRWLQAEGETKEEQPQRVVVSFGPEYAPLEQRQVELALDEAERLRPTPKLIVFASFHFDPEAAKNIDETEWAGVTLLKAQMNTDLFTEDLKKKRAGNESFWLIGQPDVRLTQTETGKYQVEVLGFDYYNPKTGTVESGGPEQIALWLLDTDYDGRSLLPRQVFFPLADEKGGWARLARNLKAEIDPELIEVYRGTVSLPFEPGEHKQVAVKIVDDRGIESLKIIRVE